MEDIKDALKKATVIMIGEVIKRQHYRMDIRELPLIQQDSIQFKSVPYCNPKQLHLDDHQVFFSHEDVQTALSIIENNQFFKAQPFSFFPSGELTMLLNKYFIALSEKVGEHLDETDLASIDEEVLSDIISEYLDYLGNPNETICNFAITKGLVFAKNMELIPNEFYIRKISVEEIRRLNDQKEMFTLMNKPYFYMPDLKKPFDIAVICKSGPRSGQSSLDAELLLQTLFIIILLAIGREIRCENIYHYPVYEYRIIGIGPGRSGWMHNFKDINKKVSVPDDEYDEIKKIWTLFHESVFDCLSSKEGDYLSLSIDRFFRGFYESNPFDKLIDYMIAFEALFTESKGGAGNQISRRCAHLIGKNKKERLEVFENLRKSYQIRSDFVHGDVIKNPTLRTLPKLLEYNTLYLRESIKYFLQMKVKNIERKDLFHEIRDCEISENRYKLSNFKKKLSH